MVRGDKRGRNSISKLPSPGLCSCFRVCTVVRFPMSGLRGQLRERVAVSEVRVQHGGGTHRERGRAGGGPSRAALKQAASGGRPARGERTEPAAAHLPRRGSCHSCAKAAVGRTRLPHRDLLRHGRAGRCGGHAVGPTQPRGLGGGAVLKLSTRGIARPSGSRVRGVLGTLVSAQSPRLVSPFRSPPSKSFPPSRPVFRCGGLSMPLQCSRRASSIIHGGNACDGGGRE